MQKGKDRRLGNSTDAGDDNLCKEDEEMENIQQ